MNAPSLSAKLGDGSIPDVLDDGQLIY